MVMIARTLVLSALLLLASAAHAATYNVVTGYGAVPNDGLDDGAAIINAATALQTAGHGVLYFPSGTYNIYTTGTTYAHLANLTGVNGVSILCDGCTMAIDSTRVFTASYGTMFAFTDCSNIRVDGFRVTGPVMDITSATVKGVEFVRMTGETLNADFPMNRVQGVLAGIIMAGHPDVARNVNVGLLDVKQAWYGMNLQNIGDNVTVDLLRTDTVHRSYFAYGVRNHKVRIESKDAYGIDVPLGTTLSRPFLEDIDITYLSRDTTASHDGGARVQLFFNGDSVAQRIRNVRLAYDLTYGTEGHNGAEALQILKRTDAGQVDTLDRGHTLDGLEITGYVGGTPDYPYMGLFNTYNACAWGTGDYWRNIAFRDLFLDNTAFSRMDFGALQGPLLIENVVSGGPLGFNDGGTAPPSTGQMTIVNSTFPNQHTASGGYSGLQTVSSTSNITLPAGWSGKTLTNLGAGSDVQMTLPTATLGTTFRFVNVHTTHKIVVDPSGTEAIRGKAAGKYVAVPAGGTLQLHCHVAGTWDILASYGTLQFEP